mmetsp:Transcript_14111/g.46075  ORF Transcript_14111/g.46075 Transcript_14111/m.46075 type:complete len:448 (+) Transcript_14111:133-1476(+)|eukprot:CAMPEP_0118919614 /NCGR_PEP_ID=MMETSP1166-20130328/18648_1 /TAXON_ID=1104430 /ORGANISM="Chrysoreinhardia sp, Strain CCMP3193" /LENGTH=447 /DNA_ID=CAMNT_0006860145 /DNA_START=83 /DNA_END=1426 /DNA_ORIENTATION=+
MALRSRKREAVDYASFEEPCHTTIHLEPRPEAYDKLRFVYVKRVFITPPEVLAMGIQSGQKVLERMLAYPFKTFFLAVEAGFLLSFGVLLSVQVGGRFGSTVGANNLVFAAFGIPFGLTFLVIVQGSELMTANYMYTSFAVLEAFASEEKASTSEETARSSSSSDPSSSSSKSSKRARAFKRSLKATALNWIVCWFGNFCGAVLHFTLFAWQSGLIKTVKIKGSKGLPATSYSDPLSTLEHEQVIYFESQDEFRAAYFDSDFCEADNYVLGNVCKILDLALAKCTANFATTILRGWGCNWMVCLAMWLQTTATEPISKLFMIWLPITLFVAVGLDHFVVNCWLLPGAILIGGRNLDHRINWGNAFFFNLLPATIGSILGAWCLVGHIWFVYKEYYFIAQQKRQTYRPVGGGGVLCGDGGSAEGNGARVNGGEEGAENGQGQGHGGSS